MVNVGLDFDQSRSDDFFYIPREGFDNEDVKSWCVRVRYGSHKSLIRTSVRLRWDTHPRRLHAPRCADCE
jgi:hypothetical protein